MSDKDAKADKKQINEIKAYRRGRKFALQAIYQWQVNGGFYDQLEVQFKTSNSYQKYVDWDLFETLVKGVMQTKDELDNLFIKLLPADISDVNPIELAVLRLGCYELKHCPDTPFKVVISEYVDLAHEFGAQLGEKFVNSILDKVAKELNKTSK